MHINTYKRKKKKSDHFEILLFTAFFRIRVFLMGPCHRIYMQGAGLSKLKTYETPIGNIELDHKSKSLCIFFNDF